MKLLLSSNIFGTEFLPEVLPLIREAGFRHLEVVDSKHFIDHESILDNLLARATDCGISIPNWHLVDRSPFGGGSGGDIKAGILCIQKSMDRGSRIGASNHVLHWFHRFLDPSYDVLWREVMDEWTDHAKRLGIRLLMESVPDKPSNERYVPSSEIIDFVRNFPPEVLSVCVDVNHSNLKEELPDVVHVVKDRLVSLHVSDNDGHSEQHWLPGQGVIDFPSLFETLESLKFDGMIVLEVNKWCEKPDDLSELKQLYKFAMTLLVTKKPHPATPLLVR